MVANALFADGAARRGRRAGAAAPADAWRLAAIGLVPAARLGRRDDLDDRRPRLRDDAVEAGAGADRRAPAAVAGRAGWRTRAGARRRRQSWAIHPGGPQILTRSRRRWRCRPADTAASREVFARVRQHVVADGAVHPRPAATARRAAAVRRARLRAGSGGRGGAVRVICEQPEVRSRSCRSNLPATSFRSGAERAVLVSVALPSRPWVGSDPLDELRGLATTAGATSSAALIQKRQQIHPATYIGKGKVEELDELVEADRRRRRHLRQRPVARPRSATWRRRPTSRCSTAAS